MKKSVMKTEAFNSAVCEAASGGTSCRTWRGNPWTSVPSAEDAALGAGVESFTVPALGTGTNAGPVNLDLFRCMKGLAEARGKIGTAELLVRKGLRRDDGDVSGDYNSYKYDWTMETGGDAVHCRGNEEGRAMQVTWSAGRFSYTILVRNPEDLSLSAGLDEETVSFLVQALRQAE